MPTEQTLLTARLADEFRRQPGDMRTLPRRAEDMPRDISHASPPHTFPANFYLKFPTLSTCWLAARLSYIRGVKKMIRRSLPKPNEVVAGASMAVLRASATKMAPAMYRHAWPFDDALRRYNMSISDLTDICIISSEKKIYYARAYEYGGFR